MKVLKVLAIVLLAYLGVVVAFESLIGIFQPRSGSTLVLTTFDEDGNGYERVVSRLESDGNLYVAANHWPRAWYERARANPRVKVTIDGETRDYRAVPVPVGSAEHERVDADNPLGPVFRFLTGFPPRVFIRLEARESQEAPVSQASR